MEDKMTNQGQAHKNQSASFLKKFLNEEQDPNVISKVHPKVSEILTRGEEIVYMAVQNKPLVNIAPDCVVLTNRRFIIYKPKMLGQVDFTDYIWRDLHDAKLKEGLMGATLMMLTVHNQRFSVGYLPKKQARKLYSIAQEMEEYVKEERRTRAIEEKRAAAGGVYLQNPASTQQNQTPAEEDPLQVFKKLKGMLDADLITEEEYNSKKSEILSRM
jgi:hypothetical protein